MIKTAVVFALWWFANFLKFIPEIFSGLTSVAAIIYFIAMLKVNVVDKKYNGIWRDFFRSWIKYFKNK